MGPKGVLSHLRRPLPVLCHPASKPRQIVFEEVD
jgi:hypothetical protein